MRATFDGQDYRLILDEGTNDWGELQRKETALQAPLLQQWGAEELKKIVRLKVEENKGTDGISVAFEPEGAESWDHIQKINVAMSWRTYMLLGINQQCGTRYNGSDKIEIFKGDPVTFLD